MGSNLFIPAGSQANAQSLIAKKVIASLVWTLALPYHATDILHSSRHFCRRPLGRLAGGAAKRPVRMASSFARAVHVNAAPNNVDSSRRRARINGPIGAGFSFCPRSRGPLGAYVDSRRVRGDFQLKLQIARVYGIWRHKR
uniref:Secreted protein n=1 Tax=Steinernema glaseri TaxID=37863 RepID=A0A1I7ZM65_9BILA